MPDRSVATVVVVDHRVLLARRKPGGALGGLWEFPGGKLESGEDDRTALVREFDEEFAASLVPLRLIGETSFVHRGITRALAAWACRLANPGSLTLVEHESVGWFEPGALAGLDLVDSDRKLLPCVLDYITTGA
ncbi:MAG: NUDIX domain-containing protein [Rectinemataceae bacterium]